MTPKEFTRQAAQVGLKALGLKEEDAALFTFVPDPDWPPEERQAVLDQVERVLGPGARLALLEVMSLPKKDPKALRGMLFLKDGSTYHYELKEGFLA